jgi:hypothetical protein
MASHDPLAKLLRDLFCAQLGADCLCWRRRGSGAPSVGRDPRGNRERKGSGRLCEKENHFELKIPYLGSLIASIRFDSKEIVLTSFAKEDGPPVAIPFFAFRVMVGRGLLTMALSWLGSLYLVINRRKGQTLLLWAAFLSFPLPFIATPTGWFTAEVGRQPLERLRCGSYHRCGHADAHGAGGDGVLDHLRRGLSLHLQLWNAIFLSALEGRTRRSQGRPSYQSEAAVGRCRWRCWSKGR